MSEPTWAYRPAPEAEERVVDQIAALLAVEKAARRAWTAHHEEHGVLHEAAAMDALGEALARLDEG